MKTVNQRELRNDSAQVMRAVEQGESFTVTRRGVPVAWLSPIVEGDLRCIRAARSRPVYSKVRRVASSVTTDVILTDLRGER